MAGRLKKKKKEIPKKESDNSFLTVLGIIYSPSKKSKSAIKK